jgi:protein-S-isoprenylcysteine O-methyltransferase Ste14
MKKLTVFTYGVLCYVIFFVTFLYAIGFVCNLVVPRSMDGPRVASLAASLVTDLGLLVLFALQHSVMARPGFKRWWTQFIPEPAERSTYVLASSIALIILFAFWQPLGGVVWHVTQPTMTILLYSLCAFGWALVLVSTFLINHFDLFGLRQVWLYLIGKPYTHLTFRTPGPYRLVRHPLYVGWFFAFWATPAMTLTHFVFALATSGYILAAIQLEERDLVAHLGTQYSDYRKRVPMLIPGISLLRSR